MAFWAAAAPALIGAAAGFLGGGQNQSSTQYRNIGTAGADELAGGQASMDILKQLQQFQNVGPGQADVAAGYGAQNDLAAMLRQYSQGGYAPTEADQTTARNQLAPQFEQVRQNQVIGNQQFRQQAAVSGRGPMDFAFQNRLNQTMGNQMNMLAAQQSQIAAQQPMQRLGFMQDFANLKQGLASQAMQNRMAISNLGSSIRDSERNLRVGGASTTTNSSGQQGSQQGNMLMGGLAGLGTGLSMWNKFGGGAQGAASASPWDNVQPSANMAGLIGAQGNAGSSYGSGGGGMSRMPASSGLTSPAQQSSYGVPSFLNPATAYSSPPPTNFFQGIPGFN